MTLTPTPEQQLIIAEARGSESLLVNALAGAAKTTTLCLLAAQLPMVPTICVAFNKRIAEEMAKRMPSHIQCSTMNSLGHRVWGAKVGKRLRLETDKTYNTLRSIQEKKGAVDRKYISEIFQQLLRASRLAKSAGYVPESMRSTGTSAVELEDLLETLYQQLDADPNSDFLHLMDQLLEHSIGDGFDGLIDFDDQIYLSTLFGGSYPRFPIVMVDEAQDLSPLNHATLSKMFAGRLIAVGDPHQAIYAFRGAHHSSMALLKDQFKMRELTLSTSFRCPQAVVRNVQDWVPHMRWPEWAKEGTVSVLPEWHTTDIPDGSAILCRANAPIFKMAIRLIQAGRGVKIIGNDLGAGLIKVMEKFGPGSMSGEALGSALESWEKDQLGKANEKRKASILDRAACIRTFFEVTRTLDEAIAYAKAIFNASGPIQLMTGHKSKGGEWPIVFYLDSFMIPSRWAREAAEAGDDSQMIQEKNLAYVIKTRAMECLYYINSDDFKEH